MHVQVLINALGVWLWQSTETIIAYYSNKRTASLSAIFSSCLVVRFEAGRTRGLYFLCMVLDGVLGPCLTLTPRREHWEVVLGSGKVGQSPRPLGCFRSRQKQNSDDKRFFFSPGNEERKQVGCQRPGRHQELCSGYHDRPQSLNDSTPATALLLCGWLRSVLGPVCIKMALGRGGGQKQNKRTPSNENKIT